MTANVHRRTPALTVSDGRGLPVRQVAYLRTIASDAATALVTRQHYDAAGRLVAQWDPRLFGTAPKPNLATVYGLAGESLRVDSVDAGWRLSLPGLAGEARHRWDARGNHWRSTYDSQLRVVAVEENAQPDVETYTYATASADAGHNLRGQLLEQVDPSGSVRLDSYGLSDEPLRETRTFQDAQTFVSRRTYGPSGTVLEQVDAGDHRQQSRYDLAGQLKQVQLQLNGQTGWQPVLLDAQYNAAGQIIEQHAGNGVISRWRYDSADARLLRYSSQKNQAPAFQDFEYVYDPAGHLTRLLDHVFTPRHFANQRIDGHREFSYDSLYRLHSASGYDDGPPSDIPGRPQPTDPANRLNYTQTYQYDDGGNLIKLSHVREGASHTREMFIDPASNRGVRWVRGNPAPVFDSLFDRHGNLQALQPGQNLQWNTRDQLQSVILVDRDNGPDDVEHYRYSQGVRVHKRLETHTATISHFHDVRYLPGLEIRTRDNGEELHVITLAIGLGLGNVRCLHWVTGKPPGIDADQLRYTLDDHLGSCLMELDQQARLISHEGYYPFGATAWMAASSAVEADYKTVRYSGKEMDVSGLYYYGLRYYAPWLQRWINPDPMGTVDGLNLYRMVGNNPINFFDDTGAIKAQAPQPPQQGSSTSSGSTIAFGPHLPDPTTPPPMPVETWGEWGKRMALSALDSRLGLAMLPTGTSSPASPIIVTAMATNIALFAVQLTQPNPAWSPHITWPQAENDEIPSYEVTQAVNRAYATKVLTANFVAQVVGPPLALLVGGKIDEWRGTKEKAEKKAQASGLKTNLDATILQQQMFPTGVVPENAQTTLLNQVLKLESLTGITEETVDMLMAIRALGPKHGIPIEDDTPSGSPAMSRQTSNAGLPRSRIPVALSRRSRPGSNSSSSSNFRSVVVQR